MSQPSTEQPAEKKLSFKFNAQSYALIVALILIVLIFGILTGGEFLSSRNLSNLFTQMTVIAVLAIGMTLVIVAGHIDLSRSEEHTSELQSRFDLVCRLLLE